jgi:hypothetical protein
MLRLLDRAGNPAAAPREWEPMLIEADIAHDAWERADLTRNGAALPLGLRRVGDAVRVVADWPRSGCGRYALVLRCDGQEHRAEWSVHPEKIGPEALERMLDDLEARLPASIALSLQRAGGMAGVRLLPPQESTLAAEVVRLRRAVHGSESRPGLAAVLHALAPDPHRVLRTVEQWTRAESARRPHPARLAMALTRGANVRAAGRPERVVDSRAEHTVDVYENRVVHAFAQAVDVRLRRVRPLLRGALAGESDALHDVLRAARRRAAFLDDVAPLAHAPDRLTMVLLKRAPYRAALEGLLELHRAVAVHLQHPHLDAPLENLPALYQLWGTLHVVDALLAAAVEHGWRVASQRIVHTGREGLFVQPLAANKPALTLVDDGGAEAVLVPERAYGNAGALRSFTYRQVPDVAVEVRAPGRPPRVWLFDPKYKLDGDALDMDGGARPTKVDIDKMHAYRDAVRSADGQRVVEHAAILYPGPAKRYDGGVEAISAAPGQEAMPRRLHDILSAALGEASQAAPGG